MLPEDSPPAAQLSAAEIFATTPALQFYDPEKRAGREIARSLGWEGVTGWDMYLIYAPGSLWTQIPPQPEAWSHQLISSRMVEPEHYHTGANLDAALLGGLMLTTRSSPKDGDLRHDG